MICGDRNRFAIEFEIELIDDSPWVFGTFFFWVDGSRYGNPEDTVALNASVGTARWFLDRSFNMEHEEWFDMPKEELFGLIALPAADAPLEYYGYAVDDVGMSSFDKYKDTFVLVKNREGKERLVWKSEIDQLLREILLDAMEYERVLEEFIQSYEKERERLIAKKSCTGEPC
jgi:hypothetical protein